MKQFLVGLIVLFISLHIKGQGSDKPISVDALQQEMLEKTKETRSVSCDFLQQKQMQYLDEVIASSGKLYFDKKNRLRWEYIDPFEYLIVINQGTFIIETDGQKSEYDIESNKMFSQISELIISSVNGTVFTDDKFSVEAFEGEKQYLVYLEPNVDELKGVISKIKIRINKSDFSVDQVIMYEEQDDFTEINFINKQFNEVLPDHLFTVK